MVRFGVIGYGKQGQLYSSILSGTPHWGGATVERPKDCILTAVSARSESCKAQIEALPNVRYFQDWRELIASDVCDAVVITVPHFHHHEIAIAALEAGKHVLCEKPMTIRASDGDAILRELERNPACKGAMMLNQRTNPLLRRMKDIIDSGELGAMRNCYYMNNNWWRPDNYYAESRWRGTWSGEGGGILVNQACHPLDLWIWLCGMPVSVYAQCVEGAHRSITVDNDIVAMVRYSDGRQGMFTACAHDLIGTDRLEIAFDKGKMILEGNNKVTIFRYAHTEQEFGALYDFRSFSGMLAQTPEAVYSREELTAQTVFGQDYVRIFENFADCILRDGTPVASVSDGLAQVELANAIQLSGWTGQAVELPCSRAAYDEYLERKIREE